VVGDLEGSCNEVSGMGRYVQIPIAPNVSDLKTSKQLYIVEINLQFIRKLKGVQHENIVSFT
jgi:hypothetical protein